MTLITKFKTGKVVQYDDVDDVDHDSEFVYVWLCNGKQLRCKTRAVKYYIARYEIGGDILVYPNRM